MAADVIETVQYRVWIRTEDTELGPEKLTVRYVEVQEHISAPYRATVQLLTQDFTLDVEGLLGATFELEIVRGEHLHRVPGIVVTTQLLGTSQHALRFVVEVGPALSLLRFSERGRVFQDISVPDIVTEVVREVFEPMGRSLDASLLHRTYPPRDYCTQYGEDDLAFVQRLLAEEGIAFVFDVAGETETMVLLDDNAGYRPFDVDGYEGQGGSPPSVPLIGTQQEEADTQSIQYLDRVRHMGTKTWRVCAWDWKSGAPSLLEHRVETDESNPVATIGEQRVLTRRRLFEGERSDGAHLDDLDKRVGVLAQRAERSNWTAKGESNIIELAAGTTFDLTGHPSTELDIGYLVTFVSHSGDCADVEPGASGSAAPQYTNTFLAQPLETPFRPLPSSERPRMTGPQLARVIGPKDQEIHCDGLGRIRIRMLWDEGSPEDASSCWVRVAQSWAGPGFGTMFIPRIGMEVLVTFLDGDPDRPLVTGCLYNGQNGPPWTLPADKSRCGIKTRSTPKDDGYNELRFEDAANQEQVYLHAQRNLDEVVRASQSTKIGANRTLEVGKDRTTDIEGDETITIKGDRTENLDSHHSETVKGSHTLRVQGIKPGPGGIAAARFIDGAYLLEVRDKITIKCQSSLLEMRPDGITISAPAISMAITGAPAPAPSFGAPSIPSGPTTALDLTTDALKMTSPAVQASTGMSTLSMDKSVELTSDTSIAMKAVQGQMRLDTDAAIEGRDAYVGADAKLRLESKNTAELEGGKTTVTGTLKLTATSPIMTQIEGGGGTAQFMGGLVKIN